MRITCPQCGFSRDVPDEKLPDQAQLATCPKCEHRFRFRALEEGQTEGGEQDGGLEQSTSPAPQSEAFDIQAPEDQAPEFEGPEAHDSKTHAPQAQAHTPPSSGQDAPRQDAPTPKPGQPFPEVEVPFERLDKYGFFPGTWLTIRRAMLSPALFFRAMPLRGLLPPMAFYVLLFQFSLVLDLMWTRVGLPPLSAIHPALVVLSPSNGMTFNAVELFVITPMLAALGSFGGSLLVHLMLLAMRSGERGYEATYRAMAYSNASLALAVFPYGYMAGIFWKYYSLFVGLKHVHRTSTLRVALAFAALMLLEAALIWVTLEAYARGQGMPA